jgi:hypothetical protein
MRKMNRIDPQGRVQDYRTFQILAPVSTHRRKATCAEVDCPAYLNGWRVRVEGLDPQMLHAARTAGRKYTELHVAEGESWLVFEAGQSCFKAASHTLPLDRQEIFIARDGDWRGNPTGNVRRHTKPEFWLEEMNENQGRLSALREKG